MDSPDPLCYIIVAILLVCSAFFSISEAAVSSAGRVRMKRLADKGVTKAASALALLENHDRTLYAILIGGSLTNIAAASIAATAFFAYWGATGAFWAVVCVSVLVLIFGEALPKAYGKNRGERILLGISGILRFVTTLLSPLTFVFMKLKDMVAPRGDAPSVTEEELHYLIESVGEEGVIEDYERDLVKSALEFDDTGIKDILTPRVNMTAIDIEDSPEEIKKILLEDGYSRVPVFEENIDNIIGILFAKDYLRNLVEGKENRLREMLVKPCFVHRTIKVSGLLAYFKAKKTNIAIVTDDYGGTLGLITTEDILEELVGDLWEDEGMEDNEPEEITQVDDGKWEILGSCYLRDLSEKDDWRDYDFEGDYSTVNGWALQLFGHIPEAGESVRDGELELTAIEVDGNRIIRLGAELVPEIANAAQEPELEMDNTKPQ